MAEERAEKSRCGHGTRKGWGESAPHLGQKVNPQACPMTHLSSHTLPAAVTTQLNPVRTLMHG